MPPKTWLIIGATRGIGLEFTTQLLANNQIVIATYRSTSTSTSLNSLKASPSGHNLTITKCDISSEESISELVNNIKDLGKAGGVLESKIIDVVVLNAGILEYPGRISAISFPKLLNQIKTNTVGPLFAASSLLSLSTPSTNNQATIHIKTLVFISSDSGSSHAFLGKSEDGFGAYAVSKAGLNMGIRCLALELHRKEHVGKREKTVVLALHPGEVDTDIVPDVELGWEVEGVIEPEESIRFMLEVIGDKGYGGEDEGGKISALAMSNGYDEGEASFWDWKGGRYPW